MSLDKARFAVAGLLLALITATPVSIGARERALPDHVLRRETPHFRFFATEGATGALERLLPEAEHSFARLCRQMDACDALGGKLEVWIAEDPESFAAYFPAGSPMAEWAVGVAFWGERRMVLRAHGTAFFSVKETFDHELSHLLLASVAGGRPIPRWFIEGIAIWQAGESVVQRLDAAHGAALTGELLPLADLDRRYPIRGPEVGLAYAESSLFVRWLARTYGAQSLTRLLKDLAAGVSFETAFLGIYGAPVHEAEAAWVAQLGSTTSVLIFLRDGSILWIIMALLMIWAAMTKMRSRRRAIEAMSDVEEAERALAELEAIPEQERPMLH